MYARSAAALGILAAIAFALPAASTPGFTLHSTGAYRLRTAGDEARFGVVPTGGHPVLTVSLGATSARGAVLLTRQGGRLPAPGRYPIRSAWDESGRDTAAFHGSFIAGTVEQPVGWFHGEAGWVTITNAEEGRIAGEFEIRAQGFLSADQTDEDRWVTVRGSFDAEGEGTAAKMAAAR